MGAMQQVLGRYLTEVARFLQCSGLRKTFFQHEL